MPRSGITWDDRAFLNQLQTAPARISRALVAIMAYHSKQSQANMRTNARWTDRTSNARNGLFTQPFSEHPRYGYVLAHRVDYGIWLEVRWSGKYAIINPTIQRDAPEVMQTCSTLFDRVFGGGR